MPKRQDEYEEWAIELLTRIIETDRCNSDALPGSVVKLVKDARTILRKRRRGDPRPASAD